MFMTRLHRRITAWVALVALVLGALAPAVTQARVAGADRGDWVQLCSASGMVWVQAESLAAGEPSAAGDDGADRGMPAAMVSAACAWCSLHGGAPGQPPAAVPLGLSGGAIEAPAFLASAPRAGWPWAAARPRAPPAA
jgi:hypothetical protein